MQMETLLSIIPLPTRRYSQAFVMPDFPTDTDGTDHIWLWGGYTISDQDSGTMEILSCPALLRGRARLRHRAPDRFDILGSSLTHLELAHVLVRSNYIPSCVTNADHSAV